MIEDMTIRKLAPTTQASYIRAVRNFTAFLGRSPDKATSEDLRRYQLHLASIMRRRGDPESEIEPRPEYRNRDERHQLVL